MSADPEQDHFCAGHFDGASGDPKAALPTLQFSTNAKPKGWPCQFQPQLKKSAAPGVQRQAGHRQARPADLITHFGLRARDEALYLAVLSEQMRARWNSQLYRLAAREIETSFAEARRRLDVEGAPEATG
jgi:hypothetical protein